MICGHVDSGKSTTTGCLLFELGGFREGELDKLKQEADVVFRGVEALRSELDSAAESEEFFSEVSRGFLSSFSVGEV